MTEILGIKFAPLFIPFERRLQTCAVAFWFLSLISCFGCILLTGILVFLSKYTWVILLYLVWIVYDRDIGERGGRRSPWVRGWVVWKYFRDYFPAKLVKVNNAEFDFNRNYLFCVYPHGVLSTGMFSSFGVDNADYNMILKKFVPYPITLSAHFLTPFFREYCLALGTCSASERSLNYLLSKPEGGNIVCLVVGGAEESFYCRPGDYKIILSRRRGFIRIALQNGTPLVPVFSFGETDIYNQVNNPQGSLIRWCQNNLKKLTGVAPIIPLGRGFFQYNYGIVPRRAPITTVVGKPIEVPKIAKPTEVQIEEFHKKFEMGILELFESEKGKYIKNAEKVHLEIL